MKDLKAISAAAMQQMQSGTPQNQPVVNDGAAEIINNLFNELKACYPAWRQAFASRDDWHNAKRAWTKSFIENGVGTMAQVERGLASARRDENPFWCSVGQFIGWCNGGDVDCDAAFDRFIRKEPPESNAERITRQNKGYQCRNLWNEEKARKEWAKELKRNIEKERKGELRDPEQKLIAAHTQETEWDRKLRERIQSGKDKRRGG